MQQPSPAQFTDALPLGPAAPTGRTTGVAARLLLGLLAILRLPGQVMAIRRDMTLLGAMDDRALSDIGLTRQDLRDAGALPAGEHPGLMFRDRIESRRRRSGRERMR